MVLTNLYHYTSVYIFIVLKYHTDFTSTYLSHIYTVWLNSFIKIINALRPSKPLTAVM